MARREHFAGNAAQVDDLAALEGLTGKREKSVFGVCLDPAGVAAQNRERGTVADHVHAAAARRPLDVTGELVDKRGEFESLVNLVKVDALPSVAEREPEAGHLIAPQRERGACLGVTDQPIAVVVQVAAPLLAVDVLRHFGEVGRPVRLCSWFFAPQQPATGGLHLRWRRLGLWGHRHQHRLRGSHRKVIHL